MINIFLFNIPMGFWKEIVGISCLRKKRFELGGQIFFTIFMKSVFLF